MPAVEDVPAITLRHCTEPLHAVVLLQAVSAPDVWLQLLGHCVADPDDQPTALRSVVQLLAEQRALGASQQQQIADLRAQLSAQQQAASEQLAGLQERFSAQQRGAAEHLAGLQEQLSAQQQLATEQGAQIAALHAQLQQVLHHQHQQK
jgi:chromosome segregation ATPase